MKKRTVKNLWLNKKSISSVDYQIVKGGAEGTCQSPCIGGTGSCHDTIGDRSCDCKLI